MEEVIKTIIDNAAIRAAPILTRRVMANATERMRQRLARLPFAADYAVIAIFEGRPEIDQNGGNYSKNQAHLEDACTQLCANFPDYGFYASGNAYPLPAVQAARHAGLGTVGVNGLLNIPIYGTSITIGAVLTNMPLPDTPFIGEHDGYCSRCGLCVQKCPAGALSLDGGARRFEREKCLSHRYQKENIPTPMPGYYGCDICQDVCPMNS